MRISSGYTGQQDVSPCRLIAAELGKIHSIQPRGGGPVQPCLWNKMSHFLSLLRENICSAQQQGRRYSWRSSTDWLLSISSSSLWDKDRGKMQLWVGGILKVITTSGQVQLFTSHHPISVWPLTFGRGLHFYLPLGHGVRGAYHSNPQLLKCKCVLCRFTHCPSPVYQTMSCVINKTFIDCSHKSSQLHAAKCV